MTSAVQSIPLGAFTEEEADNGTIVTTQSSITVIMSNVNRAPAPGLQERVLRTVRELAAAPDRQRAVVDILISNFYPEMTAERRQTMANEVVDELRTPTNNAEASVNNPAMGPPYDVVVQNSGNSLSTISDADRSRESRNGASNAESRDTSTLQGEGIEIPTVNNILPDGTNNSPAISSNVESASGHGSGTSNDESTSYGQHDTKE